MTHVIKASHVTSVTKTVLLTKGQVHRSRRHILKRKERTWKQSSDILKLASLYLWDRM